MLRISDFGCEFGMESRETDLFRIRKGVVMFSKHKYFAHLVWSCCRSPLGIVCGGMTLGPDMVPEREEIPDVEHFEELSLTLRKVEPVP